MGKEFFVPKIKESSEKPKKKTKEKIGYVPLEPGQKEVEIEMTEEEIEKEIKKAAPNEEKKKEKEE